MHINGETLIHMVRERFAYDCRKHDLAPDPEAFADDKINAMTNVELLQAISDELENAK